MAKIEKPAAIDRLNDIIALADGVMVARGDLGVELPPEEVPPLQNRIVACARQFGKPVVVATQMLESMITSPTPTRAEVSDVATAIYDGADAVMLSAESAAGQYPVEAVAMMDRIATSVERDPVYPSRDPLHRNAAGADDRRRAVRLGAADRRDRHCEGDGLLQQSGSTARRIARERPPVPILAMSPSQTTSRRHGAFVGRPFGPLARRGELRGNGRQGQAHGAPPPARQGRRPGDRAWPAFRSARPGRPTCCTSSASSATSSSGTALQNPGATNSLTRPRLRFPQSASDRCAGRSPAPVRRSGPCCNSDRSPAGRRM